jgi:predicted nucleic acid-binding protein
VKVIIDTCIWIHLRDSNLTMEAVRDLIGTAPIKVSAITLGELEYGANFPDDPVERAIRSLFLRQLEKMPILDVTRNTARSFGLLGAVLKAANCQVRGRYHDLWIASHAHEHGYAVLTSNPDDFKYRDLIEVIPVTVKNTH